MVGAMLQRGGALAMHLISYITKRVRAVIILFYAPRIGVGPRILFSMQALGKKKRKLRRYRGSLFAAAQ